MYEHGRQDSVKRCPYNVGPKKESCVRQCIQVTRTCINGELATSMPLEQLPFSENNCTADDSKETLALYENKVTSAP